MNNLRCYDLALELNRDCKTICAKGPIKDQLERAVLSIALNISEGRGRIGKDRTHMFRIAYGSCKEVQTCLQILEHPLYTKADRLGAMIFKLIKNPGTF